MAELEYTVIPQESANATLDFLVNRPILGVSFLIMKGACLMLCLGFAITWYNNSAKIQDYVAVSAAIAWLFYYKSINRYLIKLVIRKAKYENKTLRVTLDHKGIMDIEWKRLRYVLKNKDGYILPLTGLMNAGKFIWLPQRAFRDQSIEQEFLSFLKKFKIKIKTSN